MVHALLFQGYGRTGCNGAQAVNSNNAGGGQRAIMTAAHFKSCMLRLRVWNYAVATGL
jgi:hypothetical protein